MSEALENVDVHQRIMINDEGSSLLRQTDEEEIVMGSDNWEAEHHKKKIAKIKKVSEVTDQ